MQIDNVESLKSWLLNTLKQTVEADPDKLADYIIALLKKQKSESDLKKLCNEQLKAFFDKETQNFVNSLFDVVQNRKYLDQNQAENNLKTELDDKGSSNIKASTSSSRRRSSITKSKHRHTRGKNGRSFSNSESSESKSRSRSRSLDSYKLNKQNIEDEDDDEEENEDNKLIGTPSIEEPSERGWKRDKRRNAAAGRDSYSGQQKQSQNYNNNNQYQKQSNYDHNNKYNNNNHHPIYVLPARGPSTVDSIPIIQPPPLIQNSQYFSQQQRNNLNIIRQVNRPRSLISIPTHEDDNIVEQQQQQQPPPHQQHQYNQQKFNINGKGIKRAYTHDNNQPITQLMDINSPQFFIPQQPPISINHNHNNFNNSLQHIPPHMQHQQQPQPPPSTMMMMMMNKNSNDNNSLSNSLIVRKIPKELNCEEKMLEHFQKFGKITNIIINYNNDQNSALVQFLTHQEAAAAYKCPQPVFNNRFIRLFWLNNNNSNSNIKWNPTPQTPPSLAVNNNIDSEPLVKKHVKERLDFNNITTGTAAISVSQQSEKLPYNEQYNKENKIIKESKSIIVSPSSSLLVKTDLNTTPQILPLTAAASAAITLESPQTEQTLVHKIPPATGSATKLVNNVQESAKNLNKKQIDDRKAFILKLNEKTQKLIEEQITQQKILLQKIEQAKTAEEKNSILSLIKKISEFIEQEKASIVKQSSEFLANTNDGRKRKIVNMSPQTTKLTNKPKLISNKLVNYDASNVKKTSGTPAFLLSTPSAPLIPKTKTFTNYRQMKATASIDNRPKELLINEIENEEEKNLIVKHLRTFSTVETVKNVDDKSMVVEFSTRKDAEIAFQKGSIYKNKPLNLKWHKTISNKKTIEEKPVVKPEHEEEVAEEGDEEKLLSIKSLNESELNSESDIISDIVYAPPDDEEFEDDEEEESTSSRPWRT